MMSYVVMLQRSKLDQISPLIKASSAVREMRQGNFGIQNSVIVANFDISLRHKNANQRLLEISKIMNEFKSSAALLESIIIFLYG